MRKNTPYKRLLLWATALLSPAAVSTSAYAQYTDMPAPSGPTGNGYNICEDNPYQDALISGCPSSPTAGPSRYYMYVPDPTGHCDKPGLFEAAKGCYVTAWSQYLKTYDYAGGDCTGVKTATTNWTYYQPVTMVSQSTQPCY